MTRAVYEAWHNPGRDPIHHRNWQNRLRAEWPVLAQALDAMERPEEIVHCESRVVINEDLTIRCQHRFLERDRCIHGLHYGHIPGEFTEDGIGDDVMWADQHAIDTTLPSDPESDSRDNLESDPDKSPQPPHRQEDTHE